jgi:hypothetical protein
MPGMGYERLLGNGRAKKADSRISSLSEDRLIRDFLKSSNNYLWL